MMRPAVGPLFRVPDELRITETTPRRALIVGSCLVATLGRHFQKFGFDGDFVVFNNLGDLPDSPPRPIADYDFQVVQILVRGLIPDNNYFRVPLSEQAYETLFEDAEERMLLFLDAAMRWNSKHGLMTFVFNFLTPQQNPMGRFMPRCDLRNMVYFFRKLNDSLSIAVSRYNNAFVLDIDEIVGSFGRRYFQPDVLVQTTHSGWLPDCDVYDQNRLHPIHRIDEHYPLQGEPIMDAMVDEMLAMRRTIEQIDTVKLVVLDLDDTLWRGVLVEEEEFYSYTTEGWPLGLAEALLFLKKRGVLLALVSKNDEAKIVSLWDKVWGGKLLLEDFAVRKINWESKADNIDEVMREVNVLPPSVVFIDDNPVERAAVQAAFPDIRVLGSEPYVVRRILLWSPETQVAVITEESSRRTEMVHSQVERESARKRFSKEEFLASLNVKNDSFRNLRSQPSEISPRGGAAE